MVSNVYHLRAILPLMRHLLVLNFLFYLNFVLYIYFKLYNIPIKVAGESCKKNNSRREPHGNEWNDIICNIVKFMTPNEVRCHNMMTRLYNMNVMSWNVVSHPTVVFCNNLSDTSLASTFKKTLFVLTYLTRYT